MCDAPNEKGSGGPQPELSPISSNQQRSSDPFGRLSPAGPDRKHFFDATAILLGAGDAGDHNASVLRRLKSG
jgi:hypothetical protein